ncbi:MAG: MCE family protein [Flavipsychrobacter sp.]|nr:MCE family protein [Flavipsychrobacter sp.]
MKISKEVKTGTLVVTAIVVFFAGFYFLKGSDLFSNDKEYYCYFPSVDGLQKSTFIQIKGLNVGQVTNMELAGDKGVKVTLSVANKTQIPSGTIATLAQSDLLGSKIIRLDLGEGPGVEQKGAILQARKDGGAIDKISGELTPRLEELKITIIAFNNALNNINSIVGPDNQAAITAAIQSLKATSENVARLSDALNKESGQITGIIRNTNSITGNLAKSNDSIQRIIANTSKITGQLANAPIQKTITDLQKTTAQLQGIMDKVNNNQGSLGMLVNDKELYNNMNKSLKSVTELTNDLKARPGRYINVSVFGGKKKE